MASTAVNVTQKSIDSSIFECPICVASFQFSVALQAHVVYSHRTGFFTCAWCTEFIEDESEIKDHAKSCTALASCQESEFEAFCIVESYCHVCESSFPSDIHAIKHYKEIHLRCIYICGICPKFFHEKENYDSHWAGEHPNEIQPSTSAALHVPNSIMAERTAAEKTKIAMGFNQKRCIDCETSFTSLTDIVKHFRTEHQFEMFACKKCEKGFTIKKSLDYHPCRSAHIRQLNISCDSMSYKMKLMSEFNKQRCLDCRMEFANVTEISEHFKEKHFEVHICKNCNRGYMTARTLHDHPCRALSHLDANTSQNSTSSNSDTGKNNRTKSLRRKADEIIKVPKAKRARARASNHPSFQDQNISRGASQRNNGDGRKYTCHLCSYDLPSYEMGLNHYAEEHNIRIFECPAPHCQQLFRRFSKWARHFLKSHEDVVLPEGSEFRILLDDIMEHVYQRNVAKGLISGQENKCENNNSLNASNVSTKHRGGKTVSSQSTRPVIARAAPSIPTFFLSDTESESEPTENEDADDDVKISELLPEGRPVIKSENCMN